MSFKLLDEKEIGTIPEKGGDMAVLLIKTIVIWKRDKCGIYGRWFYEVAIPKGFNLNESEIRCCSFVSWYIYGPFLLPSAFPLLQFHDVVFPMWEGGLVQRWYEPEGLGMWEVAWCIVRLSASDGLWSN